MLRPQKTTQTWDKRNAQPPKAQACGTANTNRAPTGMIRIGGITDTAPRVPTRSLGCASVVGPLSIASGTLRDWGLRRVRRMGIRVGRVAAIAAALVVASPAAALAAPRYAAPA